LAGLPADDGVNTPWSVRHFLSIIISIVIRIHQVEIAEPMVFPVQIKLAADESESSFNLRAERDGAARDSAWPMGHSESPGLNHWDLSK
jgi:hypothetical protein